MKKQIRILSLLLVVTMMFGMLTGCGQKTETPTEEKKSKEIVVCAGPGSPMTSGNYDPLQGFLVQGFFLFHS